MRIFTYISFFIILFSSCSTYKNLNAGCKNLNSENYYIEKSISKKDINKLSAEEISDLKTKFDPRNETTKQHLPGVFFTRDMTLMSSEQIYLHDSRYHLNLAKYSKRQGKWHGHITEFQREMIHTVTLDCEIQNNGSELNRMLYILSSKKF